jgi:hypothetical protein
VTIKFNDQQIPDSPFKVFIAPSRADSTTLSIHDLQDQVCEVCVHTYLMYFLTASGLDQDIL